MKRIFIAVLALFCLPAIAGATPSTLIRIPSVDVQPYATMHLGFDINTTMFQPVNTNSTLDYSEPTSFGLTFGLLDMSMLQAELGVDAKEPTDSPVFINAKLAVPEGSAFNQLPGFAFGVYDMGTDLSNTNYNIFYVETAKTISFMGRFTLGYFLGNSDRLKNINGKSDNNGILFGYDRRLPEVNERLWFGIDYQGSYSAYGAISFGFSWAFSETSALVIGYTRSNDVRMNRSKVTWQVDFDF